MTQKISFRVRVMNFAHHIYQSGVTKSIEAWKSALRKAWKLYRLAKKMRNGVVKFVFEKVDGSARIAYGTLCNLPAGVTSRKSQGKAANFSTMCYWDTKKNAFRSFKVENFITEIA